MFAFTETTLIDASPATVWETLQQLERWWPDSNPEHESLERLDDRGIEIGARLRIRERIAGIPGEAIGTITELVPRTSVTWESPNARYRLLGIPLTIGEGVTWHIEEAGDGTTALSAHVWAMFPGRLGPVLQWVFTHWFHGIERDRQHTRLELTYLKAAIESGQSMS